MNNMNVVLVSPLPPPEGGIAVWTKMYMSLCSQYGMNVQVVNTALQGKRAENFSGRISLFAEIKRTLRILREYVYWIRRHSADMVHINSSCSPKGIIRDWLCVMLTPHRVKLVFHCRCTVQDQLGNGRLGNFFFRRIVRRASSILVLNDESLMYVTGIRKGVCRKIPNFIDDALVRTDDKNIASEVKMALFTGHVLQSKGIDELMEAAIQHPDIEFVVAGAVSEEYVNAAIPENVKLTGTVPHGTVLDLLDKADVFLFPSHTEGFSNSLTEAMARGVPIVASDVGANRDMVETRGGVIIPPKDTQALVEAIKKVRDPELRRRMSRWNVEKVRECYSASAVMQQLKNIYDSLMVNKPTNAK